MEETNIPQESVELSAEQLSELLQIRRDKLSALREAGKDPFSVITYPQTHHSAEIVAQYDALEGKDGPRRADEPQGCQRR